MDNYLYFPQCKIIKADNLPGYGSKACTFIIKSTQITPKHYPEHYMLKDKADFFFKLNGNAITWMTLYHQHFETIFGKKADISKVRNLIGMEVSILAYFDANAEITLDCIGIGLPDQIPILFNNDASLNENEANSKIAMLGSKLAGKTQKTKKLKI